MTAPAEESYRASYLNSLPRPGESAADPVDPTLLKRLADALGSGYVLGDRVARGGFCEILECCDMELDRRLAIKVLRPDVGGTHDMRARFKQEARAIARLNHAHIIPIHFVGDAGGLAYYAMPYISGRTLADLLGDQPALSARRLVPLVVPVLEALHLAHQHGIVHRDIKPDNILIEDETNRPLLLDFGIAKFLSGAAHETQAGFIVGTPLYMSPEQALGRDPVDARSDVYAFGVMLFQLVTGTAPYDGQTSQEIVGRHLGDPVPIPSLRNPNVPAWLSSIIVRCLAKRPAERFASAHELAEALRAGLAGTGAEERPRTPLPEGPRASYALPFTLDQRLPSLRSLGARVAMGATGLAAALALVFLRPAAPATVTVRNALLHPVALTLADGTERTLVPGDSVRLPWSPAAAFDAQWKLVRPLSHDGRPMGEALSGTLHERNPRGEVQRRIEVGALDGEYFSPRVTNATAVPLRFAVDGQGGVPLCDCDVPPGADEVPMGYYRLGPRTVLRLRDAQNRDVTYEMPHPIRERLSGALAMRVDASNLPAAGERTVAAAPAKSKASRRPTVVSSRRDLLGAMSAPVPPPAEPLVPVTESVAPIRVEPLPAPAPTKPASAPPRNPASGFLPVR